MKRSCPTNCLFLPKCQTFYSIQVWFCQLLTGVFLRKVHSVKVEESTVMWAGGIKRNMNRICLPPYSPEARLSAFLAWTQPAALVLYTMKPCLHSPQPATCPSQLASFIQAACCILASCGRTVSWNSERNLCLSYSQPPPGEHKQDAQLNPQSIPNCASPSRPRGLFLPTCSSNHHIQALIHF